MTKQAMKEEYFMFPLEDKVSKAGQYNIVFKSSNI